MSEIATIYKFTEEQFEQIQNAINAAYAMAVRFDHSMIRTMRLATNMMDDVANEIGEFKPFSSYPEDREKLMSLATVLQNPHDIETGEKAANELSDLVLAILSDEEIYIEKDDGPTSALSTPTSQP